jgi:signal transduction histidine kinase
LITLEKEKLQVAFLLNEQVVFHQTRAQAKNIQLNLESVPELPPILANKRAIEEVIANLLTNGVKYTPEGGTVTVSARAEKGWVHVAVKDTGYGISQENLSRIFERFYRVKDDNTRMISGTGLGLAIVKSIVEAHNGRIEAESEPGQGSTFHVFLPIMQS